MAQVVLAGVGMTSFGRFLERSPKSLVAEAVAEAMDDAGADAADVEAVFFANVLGGRLQGQDSIRGQCWMAETGLQGVPTVNVENACASGSTAVHLARLAVASGQVEVALAVGAEKLWDPDKRALSALEGAVDREVLEAMRSCSADGPTRSVFMDVYADWTRRYAERTGATREDFARVAVKNHEHGARNPKAQHRRSFSLEEVLEAPSVVGPLTVPMCAPIGDGAAAVVVTTAERAAAWGAAPVRVLATAVGGAPAGTYGELVRETARRAYEEAAVAPGDIDVVECHDAVAPAELIVMEELGLCFPGEAAHLVAADETRIGGRLPVNPSGGLEARGHPLGATGIAQLVELADQLRGRCGARQVGGARRALAENAGGYLGPDAAVAAVTVLAR